MKVGRNDPCPCGKLKPDGRPVKYKKCHLLMDGPANNIAKRKPINITKQTFISEPYSKCPQCGNESFGFPLMGVSSGHYSRECYKCDYSEIHPLPEIKKKIIYLDQFAIDNMVKTLDPKHRKHEAVSKDPFWLQMYEKLDRLSKAQLIVCPDSFYHLDESAPTDYFDSMQRIYEHLSGGVTFFMEFQIIQEQICEHFENALKGHPELLPTIDPEKIAYGELYEWHDRMHISVSGRKKKEQVEKRQSDNAKAYERFSDVFKRWQTEKGKKFEDFYKEETEGFAKGTILAFKGFYERQLQAPEKYMHTGEIDINDIFPPPPVELMNRMEKIALKYGAKDQREALEKVGSYLFSSHMESIPALRIGTAIYAALAFQASNGRTKLPSPGVKTDVDMISSLLPYCDAMLIDKENADILTTNNLVKKRVGYPTKIFAPKDREAFLQYLDGIFNAADPDHIELVKKVYGDDWIKPYITILAHKDENEIQD